jgi:hypothetical protein
MSFSVRGFDSRRECLVDSVESRRGPVRGQIGQMVERVDTRPSKSRTARCESSNLSLATLHFNSRFAMSNPRAARLTGRHLSCKQKIGVRFPGRPLAWVRCTPTASEAGNRLSPRSQALANRLARIGPSTLASWMMDSKILFHINLFWEGSRIRFCRTDLLDRKRWRCKVSTPRFPLRPPLKGRCMTDRTDPLCWKPMSLGSEMDHHTALLTRDSRFESWPRCSSQF